MKHSQNQMFSVIVGHLSAGCICHTFTPERSRRLSTANTLPLKASQMHVVLMRPEQILSPSPSQHHLCGGFESADLSGPHGCTNSV